MLKICLDLLGIVEGNIGELRLRRMARGYLYRDYSTGGLIKMNNRELSQEIEACRKKMLELSSHYSLTSEKVVRTSKQLDKLLNEYDRQRNVS